MTIALSLVFGSVIGSFLNVCIYRIPQNIAISRPRSYCPKCSNPICALDNIPIISFIILKGRCRNCDKNIRLQYPAVELLTALLTIAVVWKFDFTILTIFYLSLVYILITISFIDLEHMIIPDGLVLAGALLGLMALIFNILPISWPDSAYGALLYGGVMAGVGYVGKLVYKMDALGGGDVKLAGVLGLYLGWKMSMISLLLAFLVAALFVVVGLAVGRLSRKQLIPFGPFLALGAIMTLFWGEQLYNWYLHLF
ncbi:MAG: prepilin peptidase [Candidatus Marinimicrobia bacterium]|nr:prepilin peptidase [Candidatus Neomarinimicrobiota bacterium]